MNGADVVIETDRLTRYYGRKKAVDQVSLRVPRGSVYAFLGRNGSGKTSTIRMLLGLLGPTRGSSRVLGADSLRLTPETRGRIGYMSESHSAYEWMTVAHAGFFQQGISARWNMRVFRGIIDHFALSLDARVRTLSRGERAGLSLALTLAPEPELLILDDPAIGLDPVARRSMLESIIYLTRDAGRTVFFSSHLLDDVERVADHVAVIDRSVLRVSGPIDAVTGEIRQFQLSFGPGGPPATLPTFRRLLSMKRGRDGLQLLIVRPDAETTSEIRALQPVAVDESPAPFGESMIAYLGARGDQPSLLRDAMLTGAGAE